jgi:hypothetical protein
MGVAPLTLDGEGHRMHDRCCCIASNIREHLIRMLTYKSDVRTAVLCVDQCSLNFRNSKDGCEMEYPLRAELRALFIERQHERALRTERGVRACRAVHVIHTCLEAALLHPGHDMMLPPAIPALEHDVAATEDAGFQARRLR